VLGKYKPLDGIFLDICCDAPSVSKWAIEGMDRAGLNPELEGDRARYARQVSLAYMKRIRNLVMDAHGGKDIGIWFNSRPFGPFPSERHLQSYCDIEALPTGGNGWGYSFFPITARYCRRSGVPMHGMTGRFHEGWGDFGGLKPRAALMYECCQMLSLGGACSVGDQLHPSGRIDQATYRLIGGVFRHVQACEPWCKDADPLADIGVLRSSGDSFAIDPGNADEGALMALQQLGHQFDFIAGPDQDPAFSGFGNYQVVILPESTPVSGALSGAVREHLAKGRAAIICGPEWCAELADELGAEIVGDDVAVPSFIRMLPSFVDGADQDIPIDTDHVVHARSARLLARDSEILANLVEPYFPRTWRHFCSHVQTPPRPDVSGYAAALKRGLLIGLAHGIFGAYAKHGNLPLRAMLGACLERLLPEPAVRVKAPSHLEISVHRQPWKERERLVVHLLSFAVRRRTPALDIVEEEQICEGVTISLRWGCSKPPVRVYLAPANEPIPFTMGNGRVNFTIPRTSGHQLAVVEPE
jgi:hypothetical protein